MTHTNKEKNIVIYEDLLEGFKNIKTSRDKAKQKLIFNCSKI